LAGAPEPTIKEIPNLIERPPRILVPPESSAALPSPRKISNRALLPISLGILCVLICVALIIPVRRWLNSRAAVQHQPNSSNNASAENGPAKSGEPPASTKKRFAGNFDAGKALELIYGSYDSQKKYAKWKLTKEDLQNLTVDSQGAGPRPGTVYTAPALVQSFTQGNVQKTIVLTETVPAHYDCHACAPIIGGATFSQQGNEWQLDAEAKMISIHGGWGKAPKGELIKIGPDRYGVVFHTGDMGQGIVQEGVVIIADVDGALRELIRIREFSGDNSASGCGEKADPDPLGI
jgi:hypothetical protein